MQDLGQRRKLEREIDELMQVKDLEVFGLARDAERACKRGDYNRARELAGKAREIYEPPKRIVEVIVGMGKAPSLIEARRLIEAGKVKLDGVRLRKHDIRVSSEQVVEVL